ncbi:MAG: hypothetical protein JNM62_09690 [Flavobacteriales bacterium]|nr:hypothetical protein [Flavobacteriales bacterium]
MFNAEQRDTLARIVFGWILLALLWRWSNGAMLSQLEAPVLGNVYKDLTFWLFQLLGVQHALTASHPAALLLDGTLTLSAVILVVRPRRVWAARTYTVSILVYFIVQTTYANHHYRPIIGLVVAGLPFMFRSLGRFAALFQGLRFYVLFIYTSAGLYKVFRGSWTNLDQMTGIIENTQLELFLAAPEGWHAQLFTWLLQHQTASWLLFLLATLMEAIFIIGYFTRRYDVWLFITAMSLHIGFYFTMRFFAFELIVLDLTLLPWERILPRAPSTITGVAPAQAPAVP